MWSEEESLAYYEEFHLYKQIPLSSRYTLNQILGEGTEGSVYKGTMKESLPLISEDHCRLKDSLLGRRSSFASENALAIRHGEVAIKKLKTDEEFQHMKGTDIWLSTAEVSFIQAIPSHPNLIQFYDMFMDTNDDQVTLVMERMECDLWHVIAEQTIAGHHISEYGFDFVQSAAKQILKGLRYMHHYRVIHRDIKPENILLAHNPEYYNSEKQVQPTGFVAKISDFGFCVRFGESKLIAGTADFQAPEIGVMGDFNGDYTYTDGALDVWSLGTTLFELAAVVPLAWKPNGEDNSEKIIPFMRSLGVPSDYSPYGPSEAVLDYLAQNSITIPPEAYGVDAIEELITDPDLKDVLRACLQWDPKRRKTARELLHMPYFNRS